MIAPSSHSGAPCAGQVPSCRFPSVFGRGGPPERKRGAIVGPQNAVEGASPPTWVAATRHQRARPAQPELIPSTNARLPELPYTHSHTH